MKIDDRKKFFEAIPGGKEMLQWFGRVPSFHDAEILELSLLRSGPTLLSIYTHNITNRTDADGYFVLENHSVVTFELGGVVDLRLEGFNEQNVIWGLDLALVPFEPGPSAHNISKATEVFELVIEPLFGMSGFIQAQEISVRFRPGKL